MTNPYQSPQHSAHGPGGALAITPEGWVQYHGLRTMEDWMALSEHFALTGPQRIGSGMRRLLLPLMFLIPGVLTALAAQSLLALALFGTIAVFFWWRWPAIIKSAVKKNTQRLLQAGRNLTMQGDQWITLTPQELRVRTAYSRSSTDWQAIEKVEVTADYLFFFLTVNSAVPVRLKDIPDAASRDLFVARAVEFFQASRAGAVVAEVVR